MNCEEAELTSFKKFINKKCLFWDVDPKMVDFDRHKRFIITRVLRFGLPGDIKFVLTHFPHIDIIDIVKNSKSLDKRTANFLALYFGIDREDVYCLREQFQESCFY